ncbi:hypothetical protein CF336_g7663, partial [Tilletia laevis]
GGGGGGGGGGEVQMVSNREPAGDSGPPPPGKSPTQASVESKGEETPSGSEHVNGSLEVEAPAAAS